MTVTGTKPTDVRSPELAELVEKLSARLEAGEEINWEEVEREFPQHAAAARVLLPTLQRLAELSRASGSTAPNGESLPLGELGDYRIICEIGRGGMGVVYEAEQISLSRRVALKVLPFAAVMDPRHLQRFKNEARAAASLDHPNVVKVFGVGCERGVHFIALQFVDGRSMADLIHERRGVPSLGRSAHSEATGTYVADRHLTRSSPRTPLDAAFIRQATEWGIRAAEALEHAHSLGIVHRDVKPGNLLIDGRGEVYVADFGLAKIAADPGVTGTGDMLGTLRYMSPEQAGAQHDLVDHRSDVYSLGVTLYELLTLTPVFSGESRVEVLNQISKTDPTSPRKLDRRIPRDLETVVLKAIEKEPTHRYQSAKEFADDLRRVLNSEVVHARRTGRLERFRKWVRRNRSLAALVAVVIIGVLCLFAEVLWSNSRLRVAAEREQSQSERAVRQRDKAWRAVEDMYVRVAERWLDDEPHLSQLQCELLEKALTYYEDLARDDGPESKILIAKQQALLRIGRIHAKLGRSELAEAAYRQALDILDSFDPRNGDAASARARLYYNLATLQVHDSRSFVKAETDLQQCQMALDRLTPSEAHLPENREIWVNVRLTRAALLIRQSPRRAIEAEGILREGLKTARELVGEFPYKPEFRHELGGLLSNLAMVALARDDQEAARRYLDEAIQEQQAALKINPRLTIAKVFLRNHYAVLATGPLQNMERMPEALSAAREALAIAERLADDFADQPRYLAYLYDSQIDVGNLLSDMHRSPEAEQIFGQALASLKKYLDSFPGNPTARADSALVHNRLGVIKQSSGRGRDAVINYRQSLEFAPQQPNVSNNLSWLLGLELGTGPQEPAELIRLARVAIDADPKRGGSWATLGLAQFRAGDWKAARDALVQAMKLNKGGNGREWFILSMVCQKSGDSTAAREWYEKGIGWLAKLPKPNPEVIILRDEAAATLGIAPPPREKR